jgi:rhodanese-related sulfurtransferase
MMRQSLLRALLIAVVSAVLGLAVNAVSPRRIPYLAPPKPAAAETDYIPLAEAFELWASGLAFFLDARAPADYAAGHIAHAFNLPVAEMETFFPPIAPMLSRNALIIVYCDGEQCDLSHDLKRALEQHDYQSVRILKNGWTVWREAGHPTQTGDQP